METEKKRINRVLSFENTDCQTILSVNTEYGSDIVGSLTIKWSYDALQAGEKNTELRYEFSTEKEISEFRDELYRLYDLIKTQNKTPIS